MVNLTSGQQMTRIEMAVGECAGRDGRREAHSQTSSTRMHVQVDIAIEALYAI